MFLTGSACPAGASRARATAMALMMATAAAYPAGAQSPPPAAPDIREQQPLAEPEEEKGSIWQRDQLLGDPFGLRSKLESHGITITLQETSEVFGNVTGGIKTGAIYEGAAFMALKVDTEKLFGLPGGTFNASAWQIHGRGLSTNNIQNLNVISSIEATRASRLFELWYEQAVLGGALSVRVGQQAADQEFQVSTYAGLFLNASFGWPTLAATDLPSGGNAYPLASLGVRAKAQPREDVTMLLGVYSGNPAPNGPGDPQLRNHSGTSFVLDEGVFVIAEVQYALNSGENASGLPGIYKAGFWYNSNQMPDQRYANDGLLLANPASSGVPLGRTNNWAWYAVADQLVWREAGTKDRYYGATATRRRNFRKIPVGWRLRRA